MFKIPFSGINIAVGSFAALCIPAGQEVAAVDGCKRVIAPAGILGCNQRHLGISAAVGGQLGEIVAVHDHGGVGGKEATVGIILYADAVPLHGVFFVGILLLSTAGGKDRSYQKQQRQKECFHFSIHGICIFLP